MSETVHIHRRLVRVAALLVSGALTAVVAVPAASAAEAVEAPVEFVDVDRSPEFTDEIAWMGETGISLGYATTAGREYRPFGRVTRDAMAAFLYRYAGSPDFEPPSEPTFSDVTPETSDFYVQIEWAAAQGIAGGWSDGTFKPTRAITRDAMASFLYRLEGGSAPSGEQVYVDSDESPEHADAIEWLATQGISQGWVNWRGRVYKPLQTITRDAMAAFLYRLEHGADPVTAHAPVLEDQYDVWVTASRLNLRAEPTWDSAIVVTGLKNARALFLGAREGGWQRVRMGGVIAWAPTEYLTSREPSASPTRVGIGVSELYFRSGPSNSHEVLARVKPGTRGTFHGVIRDGWWWVTINGVRAWTPGVHLNEVETYNPSAVLSMAHSQVGYLSKPKNDNKYNDWIGARNPWCMVFVSWVFDRVGYPQGVPKEDLFSRYAAVAERSGVLDKSVTAADLERGHVVLVDWPPYYGPTHTAIVDRVEGSNVILVEGNTTSGLGPTTRGVFVRERRIVDMYAVFDPDDFARVNGY